MITVKQLREAGIIVPSNIPDRAVSESNKLVSTGGITHKKKDGSRTRCRVLRFEEWFEWEEEEGDSLNRPSTRDPIDSWDIGRLRNRGSIHCDWWTASAADVAQCGQVAVFPVTGWWRERKHLGFVEKETRYSLIITISTPAIDVDLYTPIAQQVGLVTEIST